MNILITGKNGYIAQGLINKLTDYSITSIGREDFDLTNREATNKWFEGKYFDVILHTAISGGSRLKQDDSKTFYQNISMFYNLLANRNNFTQLINFGSGAELGQPSDPYGLSKNVINKIIESDNKLNNIRIFAVFDENELNTRFIKSNIIRYKNKESLIIHQNKLMDFFYMGDLITLIQYIIENPSIKNINASYFNTYDLLSIANIINNLDTHKCGITLEDKNKGQAYISPYQEQLNLPLIGLEEGIKRTYNATN